MPTASAMVYLSLDHSGPFVTHIKFTLKTAALQDDGQSWLMNKQIINKQKNNREVHGISCSSSCVPEFGSCSSTTTSRTPSPSTNTSLGVGGFPSYLDFHA